MGVERGQAEVEERACRSLDAGGSFGDEEQRAQDPPKPESSGVAGADTESAEGFFSAVARGVIVADAEASMSIAAVGAMLSEEERISVCFRERAAVWRLFWNHMVTVLRSLRKHKRYESIVQC